MNNPISKAELSRHLGVARSRVSALVKRGLPVRSDGKIELVEAVDWVRSHCEQTAAFPDRGINKILADDGDGPPAAPVLDDDQAVMDFAAAKALRETYLARTARCAYLTQAGKLLDSELVEREWAAVLSALKARMLAVAARCGSRLPHLSAHDVGEIEREVRDALAELGGNAD